MWNYIFIDKIYNDKILQTHSQSTQPIINILFNKMNLQHNELFLHWINQQLQHYEKQSIINTNQSYDNQQYDWSQMIDNGFVYQLFKQIDEQYFEQASSLSKIQYKGLSIKKQLAIKQYWNALNQYLQIKHNKIINPSYYQKQTNFKKQLTIRDSSRTSSNSTVQSSIIQLMKVQFYLLVQKYNNLNSKEQQHSHIKISQTSINQTLESSTTLIQDVQSMNQVNRFSQSIEYDETSLSSICESKIQQEKGKQQGQEQQYMSNSSEFLKRICQLPQEVQQYLVSVVEGIQQMQIIQPIQKAKSKKLSIQSEQLISFNKQQSPSNSQTSKRHIYRQIQQVNEQNQQLKQKIQIILEQNYKLQKQIEDNLYQQNILVTKINNYTQQKQQLYQYLKQQHGITISSLEQFIQIVKHIEQQNQLLQNTITQIQQRNYQLQTQNAHKIHSINQNAQQITKINQQLNIYKSKIKNLKQDILFLDQFVNAQNYTNHINSNRIMLNNAQLITSIDVDPQLQDLYYQLNQNNVSFTKSIDLYAKHSFGNILRQNKDIYNLKIYNQSHKNSHNRVLTDSLTGYSLMRLSLQSNQKMSTHKKTNKSSFPHQFNQQNIQPTPFQFQQLQIDQFATCPSKSQSNLSIHYQEQQEKLIQQEKQKYKQQLVNSLQNLYKEIADLTKNVTQIKEENKLLQKKNQGHQKKINKLKVLHQAFIQQAQKP